MRHLKFPIAIKSGSTVVKVYRVRHQSAAAGYVYTVSYHIGRRRFLPQFASLDAAVNEARLRAGQLAGGKLDAASFARTDSDELVAARKLAGDTPLLSAIAEWAKARVLTAGNVLPAAEAWKARNLAQIARKRVSEVVVAFKAAKTKAGFNVAKDHHDCFEKITADLGEYFIDMVTAAQLSTWLAKRENPTTRNTYRKRIVSVWRWAQRNGYLPRDLKTEAEQTDAAREEAPVVGIISAETFGNLLEHFRAKHPELLPPLVLAGFCGMRRAEIHSQTWEDINLQEKFARVTKAKRGTPARRLVPLCPAAIEWFMLCPERKGPICNTLEMDRIRKLGMEAEFNLPENCFRHAYISHRVADTGNIPQASLDAGNSPQIINRHYRELVTKAEGQAWFSIAPAAVPKEGRIVRFGG